METLTFSYAKRIQDRLPVVAREHCYGCEINHPSQIQHTCLMCTDLEHLELYFDDAYERISMAEVLKTIKPNSVWDDFVDSAELKAKREVYEVLCKDIDYCEENKPEKSNVYKLVEAFIKTGDRFL